VPDNRVVRRTRVYCPDLAAGVVSLSAEESHHLVDALRAKIGDGVVVFDGRGGEGDGVVHRLRRGGAEVRVDSVSRRPFELSVRITVAVAAVRTHRQGYLVEKCTELGAAAIWPLVTDRGVSKTEAGIEAKWTRRAVEAAKQSGRAWVPGVASPCDFAAAIARRAEFDLCATADVGEGAARFIDALSRLERDGSALVLVGPEGGWSDAERATAELAGVPRVTLGPTVLRTETAAVAVCAAAALWGPPAGSR
jgi:16S rRNA (uracil1498-N3)-methyltransferase